MRGGKPTIETFGNVQYNSLSLLLCLHTPLDEWEMDESHEFMTTLSSEPAEDIDSEVSAITFNKFHFL